jgi:hypothetical protein
VLLSEVAGEVEVASLALPADFLVGLLEESLLLEQLKRTNIDNTNILPMANPP